MFRLNRLRFRIECLIVAASFFVLASCGGGGGGGSETPQQPVGTINGQTSLGSPVTEGVLTAYSWSGGEKGGVVATSAVDKDGNFAISTQASSQPLLLEITAARYKEVTSDKIVKFKSDQFLSVLINFTSGQTHSTNITPYTTLAQALAVYKTGTGTVAKTAITDSNALLAQIIDLDIKTITPAKIYSEDDVYAGVTDEAIYGFFISGLSSWMKDVSDANSSGEHDYYNTIHAAMVMYRDIKDDGFWDGQIKSASSGASVATSLGVVALDSQIYRQKISQHILNVVNSAENKSTLTAGDVIDYITSFSQNVDPIFATLQPLALDEEGPVIVAAEGMDEYLSDEAEYKCTITDIAGIGELTVTLDGNLITTTELDGEELTITVDTTTYDDGVYALVIVATDNLGNETEQELEFYMNNGSSVITVTTPDYANQTPFTITGTYFESGPKVKSIKVADVTATLDTTEKTWSAQVPLSVGKNDYEVVFTDELDEEDTFDFSVYLDRNSPEIDVTNGHSDAYFYVGGEVIKSPLQDDNSADLLYFDKDTHALNGVAQTEAALTTAKIAYFTFDVDDPADFTVYTAAADLDVSLVYKIDSQQIGDEIDLSPLATDDSKYLVPLAQETLNENWDQSSEDKLHEVIISVKDQADNSSTQTFSFKAKFDVPTLVINSLNIDSNVNVYSWISGAKGALLETCTTDSTGSCSVKIFEDSGALLVEVSDGKYRELSTGALVPLSENDILQAVFNYVQVDTEVTVTPITHIATSLASNLVADGFNAATAIDSANTTISDLYGIDILDDIPFDISDNSNAVDEVSDSLEYSILLAGISSWTNDYAQANGDQNQYEYHSVLFAELAAEDILSDGLLNGGVSFGDTDIDQSVYRNGIADGMVDVINGVRNNTTQSISDLIDYITAIAEDTDVIYDGEAVVLLDNHAPTIEASNFTSGDFFAGTVTLNFTAKDKTAIAAVVFDIDSTSKGSAADILSPSLTFDSTGLTFGAHIVGVTATDINGNSVRTTFDINIDNSLIAINSFANSSVVKLYKLSDTSFSTVLATCTTNNVGACSMRPGVNKQPLIVVLDGGLYRETGTDELVSITGLQLKTVFNYNAVDTTVAVTPITSIAAAYAQYLVTQGENTVDAVDLANAKMTSVYGFDVVATNIYSIDDASSAGASIEDQEKYSFLLAGISRWTYEAAKDNGVSNQTYYNSVLLSSLMATDINGDGFLQGGGSFGSITLSTDIYRNAFADNILTAVNSVQNSTGFEVSDLLSFMVAVAESTNSIFNGEAVTQFDTTDPVTTANNFTEDAYVAGSVSLKFDIDDKVGAQTISAKIDNVPVSVTGSSIQPEILLDTTGLIYGDHQVQVTVTDLSGNSSITTFDIKTDNSDLVVKSLNFGSTATVYVWTNGVQGAELDSCLTNSAGTCTLNPMTDQQPIIVKLTGGNYKETSTGVSVSMGAQSVTTVINYQGADQTIAVNPVTTIATGYTSKHITDGAAANAAITSAYSNFATLYGFDISATVPFDISDPSFATATVSDSVKYSFLLAGISQWTYEIGQANSVNQSTYNSLLFALRASEDINADAKLNGGFSFGPKALSQAVYKNEIADSILNVVNDSQRNKTTLDVADLITFMESIAESTHALYDGHAVTAFDDTVPEIVASNFSAGDTVTGTVNLSFDITDKTGLATVQFAVDSGTASNGDPASPVYSLDTTGLANGNHTVNVTAVDNAGNSTTTDFAVVVNN